MGLRGVEGQSLTAEGELFILMNLETLAPESVRNWMKAGIQSKMKVFI